ncbi:hypothetical protein L6164_015537 [Bauhinia variegata]|uniref:Uncharacterized protein n=1 Tax=Bauhinia variegata TaxID=167791 RepID=A0ACB9NMV5_BAUVA|nr:hypothetical protein L6164_015537 [Bauhinia variegata]
MELSRASPDVTSCMPSRPSNRATSLSASHRIHHPANSKLKKEKSQNKRNDCREKKLEPKNPAKKNEEDGREKESNPKFFVLKLQFLPFYSLFRSWRIFGTFLSHPQAPIAF